ncbi:MAG: DUF5928 domain-containing protein [Pseudomonadota bacterium]
MAKIAYILLCHKDPDAVIRQAQQLTAAGDLLALHLDRSAPAAMFAKLKGALADNPRVVFARKRLRCGWGQWSLVAATLETLATAMQAFPSASHFYLLSGDCMPIKSAEYARAYLAENDVDFIECEDFFSSNWIRTGWKEERLIYRHYVNERSNRRLFYFLFKVQKRLGLRRNVPSGIEVRIGSQWWCLRRATVEAVLRFIAERRDVARFFRTTWIPDETFFQTLVPHLAPRAEIHARTLTFLMFTDYGMPVTFYNDHYNLLLGQDSLFARKVSREAHDLKRRLGELYAATDVQFQITGEGRKLFAFLTGQGRIGRRFGPRFWEKESTLGRERELMIVVCKKWHVGRRILRHITKVTNVPALNYLFNEEEAGLPDLGGIAKSMQKRHRHRRALMRMLFDFYETDRMLICLDPSSLDLMNDFDQDRSVTRILDVDCQFSDSDLIGHAKRVGLAGSQTADESVAHILPTLRNDLIFERDRIGDAGFQHVERLSETGSAAENVAALARFLAVPQEQAAQIANAPGLFAD